MTAQELIDNLTAGKCCCRSELTPKKFEEVKLQPFTERAPVEFLQAALTQAAANGESVYMCDDRLLLLRKPVGSCSRNDAQHNASALVKKSKGAGK